MEELATIFNNVGILVAALAGGISLVMFGFAGTANLAGRSLDLSRQHDERQRSALPNGPLEGSR